MLVPGGRWRARWRPWLTRPYAAVAPGANVARRECLIWYIESVPWRLETLNATVDAELDALPVDMRARFIRVAELIESVGLPQVREPHVKHLQGPLWESG